MMRSRIALLWCGLAVASASADDDIRRWPAKSQIVPFHVEDPSRWGTPWRIVEPEYPKPAIDKGHTGYVDVEGVIGPDQAIRDPVLKADSRDSETFVESVKEALPSWRFHPPIGDDCLPEDRPVTTRVWFELKNGKPTVSASRQRAVRAKGAPADRPVKRVNPAYPREMQRLQHEAVVYTLVEVEPSGKVAAVHARGHTDARSPHHFERATVSALSAWQYAPLPQGEERVRRYCLDIAYRLR